MVFDSPEWAVTVLGSQAAFDKASEQGLQFEREALIPGV